MTDSDSSRLKLRLNGRSVEAHVDMRATLVEALRDEFDVKGVRVGCANGACGSCTALVDGQCVKSCLSLAGRANGSQVLTLEGLGAPSNLHPVQEAFLETYAFQCGFCLPGMIFSAVSLMERVPDPTDADIRDALSGNICRCTGYQNFVAGVRRAVELAREAESE